MTVFNFLMTKPWYIPCKHLWKLKFVWNIWLSFPVDLYNYDQLGLSLSVCLSVCLSVRPSVMRLSYNEIQIFRTRKYVVLIVDLYCNLYLILRCHCLSYNYLRHHFLLSIYTRWLQIHCMTGKFRLFERYKAREHWCRRSSCTNR